MRVKKSVSAHINPAQWIHFTILWLRHISAGKRQQAREWVREREKIKTNCNCLINANHFLRVCWLSFENSGLFFFFFLPRSHCQHESVFLFSLLFFLSFNLHNKVSRRSHTWPKKLAAVSVTQDAAAVGLHLEKSHRWSRLPTPASRSDHE